MTPEDFRQLTQRIPTVRYGIFLVSETAAICLGAKA